MMNWTNRAGGMGKWLFKPALAFAAAVDASAAAAPAAPAPLPAQVELSSAYAFPATLERLSAAIEGAGLTVFARIDHQAAAARAGLTMPPTTVLIYGNPKGGTPLMLAAPALALDLPLRVLVREDAAGHTLVAFHPALALTRGAGLPDEQAAGLSKAETLIAAAIQP
ncbi:MAG TPA: DUF302 domain-containing protein [Janthinobacterium sp.]|jgi:uncharacterized protein (DUF302 family)|nr:DUF302 domain-containing protein [Janthinobacterium sp.]